MGKKIYVGNLSFSITDEMLEAEFAKYGDVESARVIFDRDTNRSRGFGFVEMVEDDQALEAIEKLDGQDFSGRQLKVSEAKPQQKRGGGGGRRGGGGFYNNNR